MLRWWSRLLVVIQCNESRKSITLLFQEQDFEDSQKESSESDNFSCLHSKRRPCFFWFWWDVCCFWWGSQENRYLLRQAALITTSAQGQWQHNEETGTYEHLHPYKTLGHFEIRTWVAANFLPWHNKDAETYEHKLTWLGRKVAKSNPKSSTTFLSDTIDCTC